MRCPVCRDLIIGSIFALRRILGRAVFRITVFGICVFGIAVIVVIGVGRIICVVRIHIL